MRLEEQEFTKAIDFSIWKKMLPFLKTYKSFLLIVVIMNFFCALVDMSFPLFQRYVINHFVEDQTIQGIGIFTLITVLFFAFQAWTVICFTRGCMRIEMGIGRDMKRALFVHLQTLSFSYYNVTPVGYILSRVMNDTSKISGMVAWNFVDLLWALTYVLGVFVVMLVLNWKLALVIMLIVPAIAVLKWYLQNRIIKWNRNEIKVK